MFPQNRCWTKTAWVTRTREKTFLGVLKASLKVESELIRQQFILVQLPWLVSDLYALRHCSKINGQNCSSLNSYCYWELHAVHMAFTMKWLEGNTWVTPDEVFYYKFLECYSLSSTMYHFDCSAVEKKKSCSFHTSSTIFCKPCWTRDLLCLPSPALSKAIKIMQGLCLTAVHELSFFHLFFLPFHMALYYLFHYSVHVYYYFITFCWRVHKTTFIDISLDSSLC